MVASLKMLLVMMMTPRAALQEIPLSDDGADDIPDGDDCFSTCWAGRACSGGEGKEAAAGVVGLSSCSTEDDACNSGRDENAEGDGCLGGCSAEDALGHKGDDSNCEGTRPDGSARDPCF